MKALKFFTILCLVSFSFFIAACNDGGGGSGDTGTVTMSVTDAKPLLPENVTNLFVEFSEVWVHKPGDGWKQLELVESPYTIDLLQFQDGNTTELVPPTKLNAGKYTQVRILVNKATMRFLNDDDTTEDRTVEIPSENLKTDKNFTIDLGADSALDIVIHFDLSMSVVVSGSIKNPTYKLKPVLHLFNDPLKAATIEGMIDTSSFDDSEDKATIIVSSHSDGEEFTRVEVSKSDAEDPTKYSIFWIVPNQEYTVEIDINQDDDIDCEITIGNTDYDDFNSPGPGEVVDIGTCSE
jgi:hypothetical protein